MAANLEIKKNGEDCLTLFVSLYLWIFFNSFHKWGYIVRPEKAIVLQFQMITLVAAVMHEMEINFIMSAKMWTRFLLRIDCKVTCIDGEDSTGPSPLTTS